MRPRSRIGGGRCGRMRAGSDQSVLPAGLRVPEPRRPAQDGGL